jgi:hypothetical protein
MELPAFGRLLGQGLLTPGAPPVQRHWQHQEEGNEEIRGGVEHGLGAFKVLHGATGHCTWIVSLRRWRLQVPQPTA